MSILFLYNCVWKWYVFYYVFLNIYSYNGRLNFWQDSDASYQGDRMKNKHKIVNKLGDYFFKIQFSCLNLWIV